MVARRKVNEVFTPRRSEVNNDMYIDRPDIEKKLLRAATGTTHGWLFGESGKS